MGIVNEKHSKRCRQDPRWRRCEWKCLWIVTIQTGREVSFCKAHVTFPSLFWRTCRCIIQAWTLDNGGFQLMPVEHQPGWPRAADGLKPSKLPRPIKGKGCLPVLYGQLWATVLGGCAQAQQLWMPASQGEQSRFLTC